MGYITIHPADRERLGAPELIPFDLAVIGLRQRAALERETRKPLSWMFDQLAGVPELDERGNPIPVPVLDDDGKPVLNEDGTPKVTEKLRYDGEAFAMLVWLALWGIGIRVPWDTFEIREDGLDINSGDGDDPGKDDEPAADSATTTTDPS